MRTERKMDRIFLIVGAVLGFLGVALGAFAAHGLKTRLETLQLQTFETGVRYHMYHALALMACAWAAARWPGAAANASGWLFLGGVVLFSGSLYVLALTEVKWVGAVTPFGGVLLLAGWAALALSAIRGT